MELRDLIVTPLLIIGILVGAYLIRPRVTDSVNRRYFLPALFTKLFGAITLGFVYQFYYPGGDTFNFHTLGSRHIWDAFFDSPEKGVALLLSSGKHESATYAYSSKIYFFGDSASYLIVKLAAVFDLFTFSSYSGTACLFAVLSLCGGWMLFLTFYRRYPQLHAWLALAVLFVPSVVFWGSGLLKDTLTLTSLGALTYCIDQLFILNKIKLRTILVFILCLYLLFIVRKFLLQAFIPAAFLWVFYSRLVRIRLQVVRILIFPAVTAGLLVLAYYSFVKIGEGDVRYSADQMANTARVMAYDIAFQSGRGGSTYVLGELDGTFLGMLTLAPAAINVSLYRPYPWEVKNPLMVLSAIEAMVFFGLTVFILLFRRRNFLTALRNEDLVFLLSFALVFAFAAGISSYNFGTLSRYKIAMLPFFTVALILILRPTQTRNFT